MTLNEVIDISRLGLGGSIAALSVLWMLGAIVGLLRFPDAFTRLHAASGALSLACASILAGLAISSPSLAHAGRMLLLLVLVLATGPVLSHIVARAAHAAGLAPIVGSFTAPRPGARINR